MLHRSSYLRKGSQLKPSLYSNATPTAGARSPANLQFPLRGEQMPLDICEGGPQSCSHIHRLAWAKSRTSSYRGLILVLNEVQLSTGRLES